jgi:hypothetical protein
MSRAQPKSSATDELARRIAQAIAKGRPPRSAPPSIGTAKAPRAKSLPLSRARLATCPRPAEMSRLPLVICFYCSGCLSIYVTAPIKPMRTRSQEARAIGHVHVRCSCWRIPDDSASRDAD